MKKIVFEIEDSTGNTLMSFIWDCEKRDVLNSINCTLADIDGDYMFDTASSLVRIQQY